MAIRLNRLFKTLSFIVVLTLVASLAWLTLQPEEDPCANPQGDISAAVLADEDGDQEALVNRSIIVRGECEEDQ